MYNICTHFSNISGFQRSPSRRVSLPSLMTGDAALARGRRGKGGGRPGLQWFLKWSRHLGMLENHPMTGRTD